MAQLGIRKFDDLVGRVDLLNTRPGIEHWKAMGLDFTKVSINQQFRHLYRVVMLMFRITVLKKRLINQLIKQAMPALEKGQKVQIETKIINVNAPAEQCCQK